MTQPTTTPMPEYSRSRAPFQGNPKHSRAAFEHLTRPQADERGREKRRREGDLHPRGKRDRARKRRVEHRTRCSSGSGCLRRIVLFHVTRSPKTTMSLLENILLPEGSTGVRTRLDPVSYAALRH
ncbi:unnamed protein product [Gadus morhua 'NCC']